MSYIKLATLHLYPYMLNYAGAYSKSLVWYAFTYDDNVPPPLHVSTIATWTVT